MIGIERTEIDRSQVLRPVPGSPYGMVLQVPYGPVKPIYIDTEGDFLDYFSVDGKPSPTYKDYYEAMILLKQTPILACRPQGDALYGGILVDKGVTGGTISALGVGITSVENYTFLDNDVQFLVAGADPSADNANYSITIGATSSTVDNTFDLSIYYDSVLIDTFNVSLLNTQKDGFGNSVYIEEVIKNRADIQVLVNTASNLTILPTFDGPIALGGGVTITTFSTASTILAWNNFIESNKYYTNFLVDCSCNATIGKAVLAIAEDNWYQHCFFGAPSIKSTNAKSTESLNTWKTSVMDYRDVNGTDLNVNSDHGSLFANWGEVSDNYNDITVWISPVSTAASRKAFTDKNISYSQAACGLNRNRGIINEMIQLEQDPSSIVDTLENVQINTLTYTPVGKCVWNERTLQTSYTNTSFISHRTLFNSLEENIESLLLTYVFTDNNQTTRSELRSLVENYVLPLVGTHLDDAEVKCDAANNTADIINQRKMKLQVAVIPYPKANKIIFEFIHTKVGVSLSEVF